MLFVGMIATCAGCRGEKTPGNETDTTTSVTATTAAITEVPTTTQASTITKTPTSTQAPTTIKTTATEETGTKESVSTTTSSPFKQDLQIGGSTFTLDGHTFQMGKSPKELLDFLGEPESTSQGEDDVFYGIRKEYYYPDIIVCGFVEMEDVDGAVICHEENEFLCEVYFTTDRYAFDGIAVGVTAEQVEAKLEVEEAEYMGHGKGAGPGYRYDADKGDRVYWRIVYPNEEDLINFVTENRYVPKETKVWRIGIYYTHGVQ